MTIVDGYMLNARLEQLYREILVLDPIHKVTLHVVEHIPDHVAADSYQEIRTNGEVIITALSCPYTEALLSHELLHVYLVRKGFPNYFHLFEASHPIAHFGMALYNHVMHKLILEEQLKRGFDLTEYQQSLLHEPDANMQEDEANPLNSFLYSQTILTMLILGGSDKEAFLQQFKAQLPQSYRIARRLQTAMNAQKYQTPYETRLALVRTYLEFDQLVAETDLATLDLHFNIGVRYYPTEEQLHCTLPQLFVVRRLPLKNANGTPREIRHLVSREDGQLSFLFDLRSMPDFDQKFSQMALENLYRRLEQKPILR